MSESLNPHFGNLLPPTPEGELQGYIFAQLSAGHNLDESVMDAMYREGKQGQRMKIMKFVVPSHDPEVVPDNEGMPVAY